MMEQREILDTLNRGRGAGGSLEQSLTGTPRVIANHPAASLVTINRARYLRGRIKATCRQKCR